MLVNLLKKKYFNLFTNIKWKVVIKKFTFVIPKKIKLKLV